MSQAEVLAAAATITGHTVGCMCQQCDDIRGERTHPEGDYRPTVARLIAEVERLNRVRDSLARRLPPPPIDAMAADLNIREHLAATFCEQMHPTDGARAVRHRCSAGRLYADIAITTLWEAGRLLPLGVYVDEEYQFGTEKRTVWVGPWESVTEPLNDIDATGQCCCAGCIGMGPCDLDPLPTDDNEDDLPSDED